MGLNYGHKHFERVLVFRPHNVYGPNMGWQHVLLQFVIHAKAVRPSDVVAFPPQETGAETGAIAHIDHMIERGKHLGIFRISTDDKITIAEVAHLVTAFYGRQFELQPGPVGRCGGVRIS